MHVNSGDLCSGQPQIGKVGGEKPSDRPSLIRMAEYSDLPKLRLLPSRRM